jgi:hypothetical protein
VCSKQIYHHRRYFQRTYQLINYISIWKARGNLNWQQIAENFIPTDTKI